MPTHTYTAATTFGTFTRRSTRIYTHCVARADGWHQFSQSRESAEREARYQRNKGRAVEVVEVAR